jgi:5-methyltetrahydropteroyltriglutamate--homocysteine methyltransferase
MGEASQRPTRGARASASLPEGERLHSVPHAPILTTVIGSYPFPSWLEFCAEHVEDDVFGPDDLAEIQQDAVIAAVMDQVRAGLDVISDGEQSRFDFNLSFYAFLDGLELERGARRRFGPPGTASQTS